MCVYICIYVYISSRGSRGCISVVSPYFVKQYTFK